MGARRPAVGMALWWCAGAIALGCAGEAETPNWELAKPDYDPFGSGAFLGPGNDSRANLLLLMADRHGLPVRDDKAEAKTVPLALMTWRVMRDQAAPGYEEWVPESSRCQTLQSGAADYQAGLAASRASVADKAALAAARTALTADCDKNDASVPAVAASSGVGRGYAAYLAATADFYGGRWEAAAAGFGAAARTDDRWLRDAGSYMVARTQLNRALAASFDEWGGLAEAAKRDAGGGRAAAAALAAYLKSHPEGRYAASARGLIRRAHWVANDGTAMAADYAPAFAAAQTALAASRLIDEADYKLIGDAGATVSPDPVMLAAIDLMRMRPAEGGGASLSHAELMRQAPVFKDQPELFAYLQAAHAWFVGRAPAEVLRLIPDRPASATLTYLEFSRRALRTIALDALKRDGARGEIVALFPVATRPYQRAGAELLLARHDERAGHPERVFAENSPVTHPVMRDLLLLFTAGPDLLRRQARAGPTAHERNVALYILLAKQVQRGFYAEALRDLKLMPASPPDNGWFGAQYYSSAYNDTLADPPLARFAAGPDAKSGCPALAATLTSLAANRNAIRPRLCLAEFLRGGFDQFDFDTAAEGQGLGEGPSQFPGKPYVRMATYMAVLADPRASADDKAFALNRAVRCYAPAGASSCGGEEVPVETRRAWYNRLKRDYAATRWAKDLRYYW